MIDLIHEALAVKALHASVIDATDIGTHAVEAALHNWEVGPLCKRHRETGEILGPHGKDPVGRHVPHGVLDFTSEVATVIGWWSSAPWNIGVRVPPSMFVLDVDGPDRQPHPGTGLQALAELEDNHGPLPATFTQITGSGGLHLFFRRPAGKLTKDRLPAGLEFKDHGGYVVWAPSIHPDSGERYIRCDHGVAAPPRWLVDLIVTKPAAPQRRKRIRRLNGPSTADEFNADTSWADILMPHGWACRKGVSDDPGAVWLHPTHTSNCSATIGKDGRLYVYSSSTAFDTTEAGNPRGYSKFDAYALLEHGSDWKAAAGAIRKGEAP